jgi:hypothetical protein
MKIYFNSYFITFIVLLISNFSVGEDDTLGTGVDEERDVMDTCSGAAGPRPINNVNSPGRTNLATVDDVNGGFCGVEINTPGIWWWYVVVVVCFCISQNCVVHSLVVCLIFVV